MAEAIATALHGRYVKRQAVGRGAYGEVWLIERVADGKRFVAKVMQTEKQHRYDSEVKCLISCEHFGIIGFVESVLSSAGPVIVLEFADGGDLSSLLKANPAQKGFFEESWIGVRFVQLALALNHIHAKRMMHRDIKTANILLTTSGFCKLSDFGFSKAFDSTVSQDVAETFLGTPYYLAPELWRRQKYSKKADMWSLGVVLYEMMLRKRPFVSSSMKGLMSAICNGEYAVLGSHPYSQEMTDVLLSMLQVDPRQRASTSEVLCKPVVREYARQFLDMVAHAPNIPADEKSRVANTVESQLAAVQVEVAQGSGHHNDGDGDEEAASRMEPSAVLEGAILIGSLKEWKQRYVVLEDGALKVTRVKEDKKSQRLDLPSITKIGLPQLPDGVHDDTIFVVYLSTGFSVWMKASSAEERDLWIQTVRQTMASMGLQVQT